MRRFRPILLSALAGMAAGCGGGGGDGGNGPPTITSVVINGDSTVIIAGTRSLSATAMAGATPVSTGVTFQWSSSDTTRATVSASGLVSGVRLGSTNVTALAVLNGTPTSVSSSAHAVRTRIGAIAITPGSPSLASLGDTAAMTAEARNALNAPVGGITFTWQSRTPGVASATAKANTAQADVVAVTNGTARIVVTGDGVSDSVTATVQQVATTSFSITPDTTTFHRIGATLTPIITAADARGNPVAASAINWNSANTAAATVNGTTGVVTSVNEGASRIVATSGAFADTIRVGVALVYKSAEIATSGALPAPIDSGVINKLNGSLQLGLIVRDSGNTIVPNPQGIAWSLKTGAIASIGASSGLITGNTNTGRDTVVLVARTARDSAPVVVRQVVATIGVTPASPAALNFVGDTQRFAAQPLDSGGAAIPALTITWSTNNAVLGINAAGLATALQRSSAAGVNVKVRAATGGVTDSSRSIVVKQVPASANLNPNSFGTLRALGRQASASCDVLDSADDTIPNHLCTWTAGTPGVVSFSPATAKTTTVTAVGNGTTTIQAQAAPTLFGFNSISVDQVAASVSLLPVNVGTPDVQMTISQSAPFIAIVRDSTNNVDARARTDVAWTVTPGTHATLSASTSAAVTVTTNASAGSETVRATIGAVFGERIVAVAATGIKFSGATGVQSVFTGNCTSCHSGAGAPEGMSLASGVAYGATVDQAAGESPLKRVRPFRPDSSYLVHKIQGTQATVGGSGARMPFGCSNASCLPNATINLIRNWILQGAVSN
ncbi:MAG: beta strand repeat-containing protein [Gemmatimonadales bacterium]